LTQVRVSLAGIAIGGWKHGRRDRPARSKNLCDVPRVVIDRSKSSKTVGPISTRQPTLTSENGMSTTALPAGDLEAIRKEFDLGAVHGADYLTTGLMNRNWRISTERGEFALKQITDVTIDTARRNLRTLDALQEAGVPVSLPLRTAADDPVVVTAGRGYCLLPWITGSHIPGPELTLEQAHELGATIAELHNALQQRVPTSGLPPITSPPTDKSATPDAATAEANRYQSAAYAAGSLFDQQVIELLDRRKTLIDKHCHEQPSGNPRGPYGWTHGDLQHRNIMWRNNHIVALIDWDRIRVRPYAEELVRTATIQFSHAAGLDLPRVAALSAGYCAKVAISADDLADGVHRLWWKRLTDFWHLDYHYDRDDHSCDDLFFSGETTLEWWTVHREEVQHAFTAAAAASMTTNG
jgi:homoserine kinase type II